MAEAQRTGSPYLVIGPESPALALDRALEIVGFRQGSVVTARDARLRCEDLEADVLEVFRRGVPRTLIHLAFGADLPATVIRTVHFFRSRLLWDGSYVAIVADSEELDAVARSNLIGKAASSGLYGENPGHHVLRLPITLSSLSRIIQESRPMYVEEWWKLLDSAGVTEFFSELRDSSTESSARIRSLSARMESVFRSLTEIEWWLFVKDHHAERVVRRLLTEYEKSGGQNSRSPAEVLRDLREAFCRDESSA